MRTTKAWLEAATALLLAGLVLFGTAMMKNHGDLSKLNTERLETSSYPIREGFQDILVEASTADILFISAEDESCRVVCRETEDEKYRVTVRDGTLEIREREEKKGRGFVGISFETPSITVYLPEAEYGALCIRADTGDVEIPAGFRFASLEVTDDTGSVASFASVRGQLRIQTDTGDIRLEELSADALDLSVSTGAVTVRSVRCDGDIRVRVSTGDALLSDAVCADLITEGGSGGLWMQNVTAEGKITIVRSTGDVLLEDCDAAALSIRTDTGDVTGSLCSEKEFLVRTDTGDVNVPQGGAGGPCEIETDTGDVWITLA